jgi:hypothetical protein
VPEGVKQVVSQDDQFTIGALVEQAPEVLSTSRGAAVFKYYHLSGVHSPLSVSESLQFTESTMPFSRENYIRQAKANVLYLEKFLEKLIDAGIYDKSLIVVVGDHGSGESSEMYIEPPNVSRDPYRLDGTKRNFRRDKARAIPLVLVKPLNAHGSMVTSDAPVELASVPATILAELGVATELERPSMFDVQSNEQRTRFHSAFEFSPNKSEYVDDITVYRIDGDSWKNGSWTVHEIRRVGYTP